MHDSDLVRPGSLKLVVQSAMVGEVPSNLAGLHSFLNEYTVELHAYFFTEPSASDLEHVSVMATEIIAHFPAPYVISDRSALISTVKTNRIPWNYLRAEALA